MKAFAETQRLPIPGNYRFTKHYCMRQRFAQVFPLFQCQYKPIPQMAGGGHHTLSHPSALFPISPSSVLTLFNPIRLPSPFFIPLCRPISFMSLPLIKTQLRDRLWILSHLVQNICQCTPQIESRHSNGEISQ